MTCLAPLPTCSVFRLLKVQRLSMGTMLCSPDAMLSYLHVVALARLLMIPLLQFVHASHPLAHCGPLCFCPS